MWVKNKSVPTVAVPECGERCHVYVLNTYLAKLCPEALEKDNFMFSLLQILRRMNTSRAISRNRSVWCSL